MRKAKCDKCGAVNVLYCSVCNLNLPERPTDKDWDIVHWLIILATLLFAVFCLTVWFFPRG